jgi:DNA-binding IclR family transcriptional regulator
VIAALSVTVPTDRFTDRAVREKFAPGMHTAAKAIEARLHPADSSSKKTFRS